MENQATFPEIVHFINFMSDEEKEIYNRDKHLFGDNTLKTQYELLKSIANNCSSPSDILLFSIGKILFYLAEYDQVSEWWKKYNNLHILLWKGLSEFRKGNFNIAERFLTQTVFSEDQILQIEGKIGLARVADRKGNKKDSKVLLEQIYSQLATLDEQSKTNILKDTKFRVHFGDLWINRTERNVDQLLNQCKEILIDAEEYLDRIHIADFNMLMGIFYKYLGSWPKAKTYFEISRAVYRDLGNLRGEVAIMSNYADVERMEGKLDGAQGRLLSVISFYEQWEDKRSLAVVHSGLAEIYSQKRQYNEAIYEFTQAKEILHEIDAHDEQVDFALAELYIELKDWENFNETMASILERKTEEEIALNPQIMFFYGKKEIQNLNLSKAKSYLSKALNLAGEKRLDHLGAKILVVTLQIILYNYISQAEEYNIIEISKLIEDLKLFIEETQKETVFIQLIEEIENYNVKLSNQADKSKQRTIILEMQKAIKELADLIRYSTTTGKEPDFVSPTQLVILHRSGIPIKRYMKKEKIVDDVLLFGGMVRAAQDIVTEVFTKEAGKVMKIDYGEDIIILAEFGDNDTGIVLITSKDTFHQRRSLHEAVKELNNVILPKKFHGEIEQNKEESIDNIISKWFGEGYKGEK